MFAINIPDNPRTVIQRLLDEHTKVYRNIQHLSSNGQQSDNLTEQLTDTVHILVGYHIVEIDPLDELVFRRT